MKETLRKKIKQYSALAGTIAATGTVAQGQIMYTDIPDYTSAASGDTVLIDLNQDGTTDFVIRQYVDFGSAGYIDAVAIQAFGTAGNEIAGSAPSGYNYPFKMNAGDTINANVNFITSSGTMAFAYNGSFPFGEFWSGDGTEGFLGLKFNNAGATHYGWARVQVDGTSAESFTLFDYALNLTADEAIRAGDTAIAPAVGVNPIEVQNAKIIRMRTDIMIATNGNMTNGVLRIVNMAGQLIDQENIISQNHFYNFSKLAKGMYIVSAQFNEGTITEKMVIE